jgi:hypothetical protein
MIIKVIPETEAEKKNCETVVHNNVKEFFIMGTKLDEDRDAVDFHDWKGGYRALIGGLSYFLEKIKFEMNRNENEERDNTYRLNVGKKDLANLIKPHLFKTGSPVNNKPVEIVELEQEEEAEEPINLVKK